MNIPGSELINNRFKISECLKKDDHSAVYTAFDEKNKKVIIKVLNTSNLPDNSILERFKREAKILSGLEHPNINNVLEYWSEEEKFFISFEYFESKNLRNYLKNIKPTEEQKYKLFVQLFTGLNYAHSKGIIHRDIKPENIIVSDKLELKIIDFGLALGMNDSLVTAQYSLVGTPSYMSPEQIQGERPSFKSDLFSAGIVAYEIYTGVNPFLGQDINDTLNKILSYDEGIHLQNIELLSGDIKEIIKGLLKKDPAERTESAEAVLKALKEKHVKEKQVPWKVYTGLSAAVLIVIMFAFYYLNRDVSTEYKPIVITFDSIRASHPAPDKNLSVDTSTDKKAEDQSKKDAEEKKKEEELRKNESKPEVPVIKTKGELAIECSPWAYVFVDTNKSDVTPLKGNILLDEGTHVVRLTHPNYPSLTKVVNIKGNQETRLKVNLDTLFGYLDCRVSPWGEVYVNNSLKGETPLQSPLRLIPGEYKVLIKNKNFAPAEYLVKIGQNQTYTLKHNFKQVN